MFRPADPDVPTVIVLTLWAAALGLLALACVRYVV
jgi:hypothetical protein